MRYLLAPLILVLMLALPASALTNTRVFVFTDINIDRGDPDDRQSLIHLLWYTDELEVLGIVPDRWNAEGYEACQLAIEAYSMDYSAFSLNHKGYPTPASIHSLIAKDKAHAHKLFQKALTETTDAPLWVLIWGNMQLFGDVLKSNPEAAAKIRIITIGTGLKYGPKDEVAGEECNVANWNGPGRNEIFNNPQYNDLWWLEINWTYNGMFSGDGPKQMFDILKNYGALGQHMIDVTEHHPWARYFRVGDTPTVTYLLDPTHNSNDPTQSSWAGLFKQPFPQIRPNYYTCDNGEIEWNYADPCLTWHNLELMYAYNKSTLEAERPEIYQSTIQKLNQIYGLSYSID